MSGRKLGAAESAAMSTPVLHYFPGNASLALARYDQASVLLPNDASVQYKIATLLDQQLRPVEALMRYKRFLHQMELERINAVGDAYAKQAEAIAHAKERIIVLEKH